MVPTPEILGRYNGLLLLRDVAVESEPATSRLFLVNLGSVPVFVHDGLLTLTAKFGGEVDVMTMNTAATVNQGEARTLFPTEMFAPLRNNETELASMIRRLQHDGACPFRVRISFAEIDVMLEMKLGSLDWHLRLPETPYFSVQYPVFRRIEDGEA